MDVRMPDGTLVKNVPDNITQADLLARYQAFSKPQTGSNIITSDVPTLVSETPPPAPIAEPPRTMMDRVKAVYEVPAAMATGAVAPFLGVGKGIVQNIQQGTDLRVDRPELAQQFQFQPTSPVSQDILQGIGSAFEASKLPPVIPNVGMLPSYSRMVGAGTQQAQAAVQPVTQAIPQATNRMAQALRREPQPTMSGVGAAQTPEAVTRLQMAQIACSCIAK